MQPLLSRFGLSTVGLTEVVIYSQNSRLLTRSRIGFSFTSPIPKGRSSEAGPTGSERTQLTFPPLEDLVSKWSPDGRQIAVHSMRNRRSTRDCSLIPREGGELKPVSAGRRRDAAELVSPWQDRSCSADFPFFAQNPTKVAVHVRHLASGRVETLPGSEGLFAPQWSPDGKYATAFALDRQRIMLFSFSSQRWALLAEGWGLAHWSANSDWVYYLRYGAHSAVMRVRISDRHVEQIASLEGIRLSGRLAGLEFGLNSRGRSDHHTGCQHARGVRDGLASSLVLTMAAILSATHSVTRSVVPLYSDPMKRVG